MYIHHAQPRDYDMHAVTHPIIVRLLFLCWALFRSEMPRDEMQLSATLVGEWGNSEMQIPNTPAGVQLYAIETQFTLTTSLRSCAKNQWVVAVLVLKSLESTCTTCQQDQWRCWIYDDWNPWYCGGWYNFCKI